MSFTVTATQTASTGNGMALRLYVLTGTAAVQNGAAAAQSATGAHEASITTTVAGSQVYGAILNGSVTAGTPAAGTTIDDQVADSGHAKSYTTLHATAVTGTPGAITLGESAPSNNGGCALFEVLPNGVITVDGSSPALASTTGAPSVTTAAFTPPSGSLLVALIAANGASTGVETVAMSDTSGLGLTWVAASEAHAANMKYAGVWLAQVPVYAPGAVATATLSALPGLVEVDVSAAGALASATLVAPAGSVQIAASVPPVPGLWTGTALCATAYSGTATPSALYTGSASPVATYTGKVAPI